jgi:hypothetical protein
MKIEEGDGKGMEHMLPKYKLTDIYHPINYPLFGSL